MMAARRIHLDIETYRTRNPAAIARISKEASERRPNCNTAKAVKESWDEPASVESRILEALRKTAVNPLWAEPLFIAAKVGGGEVMGFDGMINAETDMLRQFVEWADSVAGAETIWSAFNGKRFDLAVLLNRMARNGITPPSAFPVWDGRGWRGRVFDAMERLPTYDLFTSFVEASESFGLETKTVLWRGEPMNGSRVAEAFEAGDYAIIGEYCSQDTLDEEALYLALTHGDTWGTFDTGDDLASKLEEIDTDEEVTPGEKWVMARVHLRTARLIS